MRLGKYLAQSGVASRRASEDLVRSGRVTVEGEVELDPASDVPPELAVAVDGRLVALTTERVVYMVNKPAGVVSTASDPQRRRSVVSLVPSDLRLYPVGRLDIDTTGLILLTNDGQLAHRLMHPRFQVPKTYRAVVGGGTVSPAALRALRSGVELEDGRTSPARARLLAPDTIELTIAEGRKRQVKRMCQAVGHRVRSLERVQFGPLRLGALALGSYRRLSEREISALAGAATSPKAGSGARSRGGARPASR